MTAPPYIKYLARYQPSTLIDIIINISQNMLLIPRPRTDQDQARVLRRYEAPRAGCLLRYAVIVPQWAAGR